MKPMAFKCDICGAEKGTNNHWFLAFISDDVRVPQSLVLSRWDEIAAQQPDVSHLCGESCTLKMTQRWITTRSLYAPRIPAGDSV